MKLQIALGLAVSLIVLIAAAPLLDAQQPIPRPRPGTQRPQANGDDKKKEEEKPRTLPNDPELLKLHRNFVTEAEKLAAQYERGGQVDKAIDVYNEILVLVPLYSPAKEKLDDLRAKQATAKSTLMDLDAKKDWQFTGIIVQPGKPVRIKAGGTWTFRLSGKLTADGMPIPEELRDFPLGCLIGFIDTGDKEEREAFVVGTDYSFIPEKPGKLYLRMYDNDPGDNEGLLKIEITGTYEKG